MHFIANRATLANLTKRAVRSYWKEVTEGVVKIQGFTMIRAIHRPMSTGKIEVWSQNANRILRIFTMEADVHMPGETSIPLSMGELLAEWRSELVEVSFDPRRPSKLKCFPHPSESKSISLELPEKRDTPIRPTPISSITLTLPDFGDQLDEMVSHTAKSAVNNLAWESVHLVNWNQRPALLSTDGIRLALIPIGDPDKRGPDRTISFPRELIAAFEQNGSTPQIEFLMAEGSCALIDGGTEVWSPRAEVELFDWRDPVKSWIDDKIESSVQVRRADIEALLHRALIVANKQHEVGISWGNSELTVWSSTIDEGSFIGTAPGESIGDLARGSISGRMLRDAVKLVADNPDDVITIQRTSMNRGPYIVKACAEGKDEASTRFVFIGRIGDTNGPEKPKFD